MKVRTEEDFYNALTDDLGWRKKELSILKMRVDLAKSNQLNTEIRAGILLLYAHWEGFNKVACDLYLGYVKQLRLKYSDLSNNLLALSIKSQIVIMESTNDHEKHTKFLNFIDEELETRAKWNLDKAIDTKSNLNSKILRNIMSVVGIDFSLFELKSNLIDVQLLQNRNTIAHGNYLVIGKEEYLSIHTEVLKLIQITFDELSNLVVLKKYKKVVSSN